MELEEEDDERADSGKTMRRERKRRRKDMCVSDILANGKSLGLLMTLVWCVGSGFNQVSC